jgi:hypothetical protein
MPNGRIAFAGNLLPPVWQCPEYRRAGDLHLVHGWDREVQSKKRERAQHAVTASLQTDLSRPRREWDGPSVYVVSGG